VVARLCTVNYKVVASGGDGGGHDAATAAGKRVPSEGGAAAAEGAGAGAGADVDDAATEVELCRLNQVDP
jgi:hypothetical protein